METPRLTPAFPLSSPMMIPRVHLFEIEDQSWCPRWLRRTMTGYLQVVNTVLRPYAPAAAPLSELLRSAGSDRVLDLCSGSGGPWAELRGELEALGHRPEVLCSDLWPSPEIAAHLESVAGIGYHPEPLSATSVPESLEGTRTLFTALHHFEPQQVRAMLEDAQSAGRHFAAFEITHRSLRGLATVAFVALLALALLPRVRPRRPLALLLSYLPPLVPLAIVWDGLVSTLRSYRAEELRRMVEEIGTDAYEWRVEEHPTDTPLPMTCVLGRPRPAASAIDAA